MYNVAEILEALGKDTAEVKAKHRKKAPILSKKKLIFAAIFFACGILICILL